MGSVTGTDTGNDMTKRDDSSPAQGIETDDVTSAADADWLVALRATARRRDVSLADVLADDTDDAATDDTAASAGQEPARRPDDEATIGSPTALHDVRRLAREERARSEPSQPSQPSQPSEVLEIPDLSDSSAEKERTAPPSPEPQGAPVSAAARTPPPAQPTAPETPARSTPDADPQDQPVNTPFEPVVGDSDGPRWQAPPRLEAATTASSPLVIDRSNTTRSTDWRITALAILVALLLGVVITLLFLGGDDTPPPVELDPDGSTVVDESPSIDSIVDGTEDTENVENGIVDHTENVADVVETVGG